MSPNRVLDDTEYHPRVFAWGRYLYWCDLHRRRLDRYDDTSDAGKPDPSKRFFISLLAQWYASLWVVVEGWYETKLSDPVIDDLLASCPRFCDLLRRFRNGVYHYQPSLIDSRILAFLKESSVTYVWAYVLHTEFLRFLWTWIHRVPEEYQEHVRASFVELIGWLPDDVVEEHLRDAKSVRRHVKRMLKASGDTSSEGALDLLASVDELDKCTREEAEGLGKWHRDMIAFVKVYGMRGE